MRANHYSYVENCPRKQHDVALSERGFYDALHLLKNLSSSLDEWIRRKMMKSFKKSDEICSFRYRLRIFWEEIFTLSHCQDEIKERRVMEDLCYCRFFQLNAKKLFKKKAFEK